MQIKERTKDSFQELQWLLEKEKESTEKAEKEWLLSCKET